MILRIGRRDIKRRNDMLRGLYVDNMRLIGKHKPAKKKWIPNPGVKSIFFLTAIVLVLFGYGDHLNPYVSGKVVKMSQEITPQDYTVDVKPSEYSNLLNNAGIPIKKMFGLKVKTILIDAGHGGDDPGAIGKMGTKEKNITLDIARRLRNRLAKSGAYNVIMTREGDETLTLKRRTEIASERGADLFISIHINSLPAKPMDIIETYYFGPSTDNETLQLVTKENESSSFSLNEYKEVIQQIQDTLKFQESKVLALQIQRSMYSNMKSKNKNVLDYGVKRAPFLVLLGAEMPAVLAEVACISNVDEEKKLNKPDYRDDIAQYLENGITKYLNARSGS